jgi:hypothetical protein
MRMTTDTAVIERAGVSDETEFGMVFNAKMARILSKQIYSNVVQAPIREIICNAWDSHRAAGKLHVPLEIHLPNQMEPWFEVRDQGVGLSHEQMLHLYTQYGASTKAESNDDIGGLGLGCKAPFAYTDAFTVTSVHSGVKRVYSLFKNERGIPALAFMGEQPVNEHNGVTVRMPVRSQDFERFRVEAEQVLRWFDCEPVITGNTKYKRVVNKPLDVAQGSRWYLMENDYYNRNPSVAVMGNVAYPIKADQVLDRFRGLLTDLGVVLHFDIGELDISPTREELSYDPVTIKVIERRLDQVLKECGEQMSQRITNCATLWDARCEMHKLMRHTGTAALARMLNKSGVNLTWQGQRVETGYIYFNDQPGISKDNPVATVLQVNETQRGRHVTYIEARDKVRFVEADVSDASSRVRKAYHGTHDPTFLIQGTEAQRENLIRFLGTPPVIKASSLARAERKKMPFKAHAWQGHTWRRRCKVDHWGSEEKLTVDQGGFYVTQVHWDPLDEQGNSVSLSTMIERARALGWITVKDTVWGLNKTNCKLVADQPQWQRFDKWFRSKVQVALADTTLMSSVGDTQAIKDFHNLIAQGDHARDRFMKNFGHMTNPVGRLAREYDLVCKTLSSQLTAQNQEMVGHLRQAAAIVNLSVETKSKVNLCGMWHDCVKLYPLLRYLVNNTDTTTWQHMSDYVAAMDQRVETM